MKFRDYPIKFKTDFNEEKEIIIDKTKRSY